MEKVKLSLKKYWKKFVATIVAITLLLAGIFVGGPIIFPPTPPTGNAVSWWNTDFAYRMSIILNNAASSENLVNFTLPITLTSSTNFFWSHIQDNGNDIRFVDADNATELYFEFEYFNGTAENDTMLAWVRVPQIDATSTTDFIWLYYGNNTCTVTDHQSSSGTWTPNYELVQHLNNTSGTQYDATINGHNTSLINVASQGKNTGQLDGADVFNATLSHNVTIPDSSALSFVSGSNDIPFTVSAWMYAPPITTGNHQTIVCKSSVASIEYALFLNQSATSNYLSFALYSTSVGNYIAKTATGVIGIGAYSHVVATYNGNGTVSGITLYVAGAAVATGNVAVGSYSNMTDTEGTLNIGYRNLTAPDRYYNHTLDEIRIVRSALSAEWIEANYLFEVGLTKFTFGTEDVYGSTIPLPATVFSATSGDGYLRNSSTTRSTAYDGVTGTVSNTSTTVSTGERKIGTTYYVDRAVIPFDTSSLAALSTDCIWDRCYLQLNITDIYAQHGAFNLSVWAARSTTRPHIPLETGDYLESLLETVTKIGEIPSWQLARYSYVNITLLTRGLNESGVLGLNAGGITRLVLRTSLEATNTTYSVVSKSYVQWSTNESGFAPKLYVNFGNYTYDYSTPIKGESCLISTSWKLKENGSFAKLYTNVTSSWANTYQNISNNGTEFWANFTVTLPATSGSLVQWEIVINDTSNVEWTTNIKSITTQNLKTYASYLYSVYQHGTTEQGKNTTWTDDVDCPNTTITTNASHVIVWATYSIASKDLGAGTDYTGFDARITCNDTEVSWASQTPFTCGYSFGCTVSWIGWLEPYSTYIIHNQWQPTLAGQGQTMNEHNSAVQVFGGTEDAFFFLRDQTIRFTRDENLVQDGHSWWDNGVDVEYYFKSNVELRAVIFYQNSNMQYNATRDVPDSVYPPTYWYHQSLYGRSSALKIDGANSLPFVGSGYNDGSSAMESQVFTLVNFTANTVHKITAEFASAIGGGLNWSAVHDRSLGILFFSNRVDANFVSSSTQVTNNSTTFANDTQATIIKTYTDSTNVIAIYQTTRLTGTIGTYQGDLIRIFANGSNSNYFCQSAGGDTVGVNIVVFSNTSSVIAGTYTWNGQFACARASTNITIDNRHMMVLSFPTSTSLTFGFNEVVPWDNDVEKTLGEVNASLNFDAINWTVIWVDYLNGTQWGMQYGTSYNANCTVTAGSELWIYCLDVTAKWTHTYE
jgi:hypothetical protein